MLKYYFQTKENFQNQITEAIKENIKITYKNKKEFEFPCTIIAEQIWSGEQGKRKIAEVQVYNMNDFVKEEWKEKDLLYNEILFVSQTDLTFNFGKAYIRGIQYKNDNMSNEIDFVRVNHIQDNQTGDEWTDDVKNIVAGIWKDKIYPEEIYKIII